MRWQSSGMPAQTVDCATWRWSPLASSGLPLPRALPRVFCLEGKGSMPDGSYLYLYTTFFFFSSANNHRAFRPNGPPSRRSPR